MRFDAAGTSLRRVSEARERRGIDELDGDGARPVGIPGERRLLLDLRHRAPVGDRLHDRAEVIGGPPPTVQRPPVGVLMYGTAYGTGANWAAVSSMTCCGSAAAVAEGLVEVMPTIGMKYVGVGILPEIIPAPCCVTAAKVADALT